MAVCLLSACGGGNSSGNKIEKFNKKDFDSEYASIEDYDELASLTEEYLNIVIDAYNASDKLKLSSFETNSKRETLYNEVLKVRDGSDKSDNAYVKKLTMILAILEIEAKIKEQEALLSLDNSATSERWFSEFKELLLQTIDNYKNYQDSSDDSTIDIQSDGMVFIECPNIKTPLEVCENLTFSERDTSENDFVTYDYECKTGQDCIDALETYVLYLVNEEGYTYKQNEDVKTMFSIFKEKEVFGVVAGYINTDNNKYSLSVAVPKK